MRHHFRFFIAMGRALLFSTGLWAGTHTTDVNAASAVMIWPVDPTLTAQEKATALWLENKSNMPVVLQTRIFDWTQVNAEDRYQPQNDMIASPPVARIEPGSRQLIRLMRGQPATTPGEHAYRIIVDEIPTKEVDTPKDAPNLDVQFRMRYSIPLFTYDSDHTAKNDPPPPLSWHIVTQQGKRYLEITNRGTLHARLQEVHFLDAAQPLNAGLLGYVLPGSTQRWPLPDAAVGKRLSASINGHEAIELPAP